MFADTNESGYVWTGPNMPIHYNYLQLYDNGKKTVLELCTILHLLQVAISFNIMSSESTPLYGVHRNVKVSKLLRLPWRHKGDQQFFVTLKMKMIKKFSNLHFPTASTLNRPLHGNHFQDVCGKTILFPSE